VSTFDVRHTLERVDEEGVTSENDQLSERKESRMDDQCPVAFESVLELPTSISYSPLLLSWSVYAMSTLMLAFRFMTLSPLKVTLQKQ
jgi:hypothetical protein